MLEQTRRQQWLKFMFGIIMPSLLAIVIAIGSIYLVILPSFEKSFLESKREMIRELTKVAWGILELLRSSTCVTEMSPETISG